jgi:hypothetical integral membrane protein (TIGR02206 family)
MNTEPTFVPFSAMHALAVGVSAMVIITLCVWGRRDDRRAVTAWLVGILLVQSVNVIYFALVQPLDWSVALPFQLCDLMGWIAGLALAARWSWARTASVYIGLCLCSQAFVTPTLTEGPHSIRFWLFFATHVQIVGSGLYEIIVRGYQLTFRNAGTALGLMVLYALLFVPVNVLTGWNYGFVGPSRPAAPTVIDALGPWPQRLLWMFVIVAGAFGVLTLAGLVLQRLLAPRREN